MLTILGIIAPVYLIIAAGYLAVRGGLFEQRDTRVLGRFVVHFCVPALLFKALSGRPLAQILNGQFLLAYGAGSLLVLLGALLVFRRYKGMNLQNAAMRALGMSSSNSGYIGFPVATQLLGPPAAVALALAMLVENLLIMPLALTLAERGASGTRSFTGFLHALRGMLRNPMILAIALGFVVALLDWPVPEVLARTIQIMAAAASPVALFVIGGSLVGLRLEGLRGDVATISLGKLILHPAAVLLCLWWMPGLDGGLRSAALVYACVPMLSIYPVLAQRHGLQGLCAAALLATTMLSFATISAWLALMHVFPGWTV